MNSRKFFTALLIVTLSTSYLISLDKVTLTGEEKKSLEKSLIFPGWGQIHEKKHAKGILLMGAEIACILQAISSNSQAENYYRRYRDATGPEDAVYFRNMTEKYDIRRNQYLLAGAAVWIVNLLDIYIIVRKKSKERIRISLKNEKNNRIAVCLSYHF